MKTKLARQSVRERCAGVVLGNRHTALDREAHPRAAAAKSPDGDGRCVFPKREAAVETEAEAGCQWPALLIDTITRSPMRAAVFSASSGRRICNSVCEDERIRTTHSEVFEIALGVTLDDGQTAGDAAMDFDRINFQAACARGIRASAARYERAIAAADVEHAPIRDHLRDDVVIGAVPRVEIERRG